MLSIGENGMPRKIVNTKEISHEEWVALRKKSLGGSDAGSVCGMNPYSSQITLYADKKGLSKEREDNEAMRLGRDLEQYVAMRYSEMTGNPVRNDNFMYADDEYDFLTANIDRRIVGQNGGLECKTMSSFNGYNLEADEIPGQYFCQCQHYCMVMGFDFIDLAVLVFQRGVYVIRIVRDDDFIAQLRAAEVDFWTNFVEKDIIPAPDGSEASIDTLKQLYPEATKDTEVDILGLDQMVIDYKAADDLAKQYKEKAEAIKAAICLKLGDFETGRGESYGCSWKTQSKDVVDTKRLKAEFPDIYKQVVRESSYRVFRTKEFKERKK